MCLSRGFLNFFLERGFLSLPLDNYILSYFFINVNRFLKIIFQNFFQELEARPGGWKKEGITPL